MSKRKPVPMFSISEAVSRNISKLYQPNWVDKLDHIEVNIIDGKLGPWIRLYSPSHKAINKRDPVEMLFINVDIHAKGFYAYTGPSHDSDEYKAQVEKHMQFAVKD